MTALQLSVLLSNLGDTEVKIKRLPNLCQSITVTDIDSVEVGLDKEEGTVFIIEK